MESDKKEKQWNLSYTAYSTYCQCPKKFEYHYLEKIRPESIPSHLIFGSAVDKGLNEILLGNDKEKALELVREELKRISKEKVTIKDIDFDYELLTPESIGSLAYALQQVGWTGTNVNSLAQSLFQKMMFEEPLSDGQKKVLAYLVYFSFYEKISLIIDAFIDYVLPQIEEIVSVQENVKRGILDFRAKLKGVEGVVVCDNKTASRDYDPSAVKLSVQLAGYGAEMGAYIVFNKNVRKNRAKTCSVCGSSGTGKRHKSCDKEVNGVRCGGEWTETISPEVVPQIIIDDIPQETRELVESAYSKVEELVKTKVFPRNLTGCGKQYGEPCPYMNLCWNNDMKGLVKL